MVTPRQSQIKALAARTTQLERTIALRARTAQADLDSAVFPTGRLTLESGVPVSIADFTDATTIYYTPYVGATIPIHDGSRWTSLEFDELSLALDADTGHTGYHQANTIFDLFVFREEVTGILRLGTGPAWSSVTARGTGAGTTEITRLNGLYVNAYDIQLRYGSGANDLATVGSWEATYVGTVYTSFAGATRDRKGTTSAPGSHYLWNAHHRVQRLLIAVSPTDSWTYSTAAWRLVDNDNSHRALYVCGQVVDLVEAFAYHMVINSTTTARRCSTGIGVDSDTVNAATLMNNSAVIDVRTNLSAHYAGYPGLGYHYLSWLEYGAGANTQTWYGDNGDADTMQSGLIAKVWC